MTISRLAKEALEGLVGMLAFIGIFLAAMVGGVVMPVVAIWSFASAVAAFAIWKAILTIVCGAVALSVWGMALSREPGPTTF